MIYCKECTNLYRKRDVGMFNKTSKKCKSFTLLIELVPANKEKIQLDQRPHRNLFVTSKGVPNYYGEIV